MARRSSKRASGTGKETEAQDAVTEEAVEAASTETEHPETDTAGETTAEAADAPGTSGKAPDSAETLSEDTLWPEDKSGDEARDATVEAAGPVSGEVEDTDARTDAVENAEESANASSEGVASDDTGTAETAETREETREEKVEATAEETPPPADQAPPPTQTVVEKRGPGFVPLVLGGVVAAGIGYFASMSDLLPGFGTSDTTTEIEMALAQQSEALAVLQEQVADLDAAEPPSVDLTPVTDEIAALSARIDETAGTIGTLNERVATLEERPVFTGDVTADAAEAAEAVAAMEDQMRAQEEEAARLAAEAEDARRAAEEAVAAAEAETAEAMAAAEAEAQAAMAAAEAEAAVNELRLAVTRGEPFAEPLAAVAEVTDIPEALSAAADSGVPSLESLQDGFPAAARAALPVALRETAGEGAVDRFTAFVQGQIGGRAIAPRDGDDPDAVLSRAQAAVSAGDLETALAEISALPEGARNEMAGWIADAEARTAVVAALDTVTDAVAGAN
ncbi:MAG: hypothetical protein HLUCCO18_06800 [Rhodobacteraceae bacterium HLUCCO18]|nr:MAG: hypothetical protein HLUCCO18_06800 [Rhodobacteraceae bacterium HLUCCO18]